MDSYMDAHSQLYECAQSAATEAHSLCGSCARCTAAVRVAPQDTLCWFQNTIKQDKI